MANFVHVTENDLFYFLSPAPSTNLSTMTTADIDAGSPSSQSIGGVSTASLDLDTGASSSQSLQGLASTSPENDDQEALNTVLDQIFEATRKTKTKSRSDYLLSKKGWFITQLMYDRGHPREGYPKVFRRADGYGHRIRLISETRDKSRPLELRTEFRTDGLVLQLVVADYRHLKKKKSKYRYHDNEDGEEDEEDVLEQETQSKNNNKDEEIRKKIQREDAQYALDPDTKDTCTYKYAQRSEVTGEDIKERRDNYIVHSQAGVECDLAARSELLANACQFIFSPELEKVIGIDPGEIVTAAACLLDSENPNARHSKKIKRTFLYEPSWRFSRLLDSRKKSNFINVLESQTPSRKHGGVIEYFKYQSLVAKDVLKKHFVGDRRSLNEIVRPEMVKILEGTVQEVIFRFYHTKWILKKRWDAKKAQTQALDLATTAIVRLAGTYDKLEMKTRVVFAIGLAVFNSGIGPSSKHMVFLKKLILKVRFWCMLAA